MLRLGTSAIALAAIAALSTGCIITDDDGDSDLTVINDSSYDIDSIRLAEVSDPDWGPNLLGSPLRSGESLTIIDIECGTYDVLVTDELNTDCELSNLRLCFDSTDWVVDDTTLAICDFGL